MKLQIEAVKNAHETQISEFRTVNREVNKELSDKIRQLSRKTKEFDELKLVADSRHVENTKELEELVQSLRRRIVEYEKHQYEMESASIQENISHNAFISDIKVGIYV